MKPNHTIIIGLYQVGKMCIIWILDARCWMLGVGDTALCANRWDLEANSQFLNGVFENESDEWDARLVD